MDISFLIYNFYIIIYGEQNAKVDSKHTEEPN